MTHYPAALAEEDVRSSRAGLRASADNDRARLRKERARWWVRRLGMLAACAQLGTAFAATRALFTTEARQRLVDMDLRCARITSRIYTVETRVPCHTLLSNAKSGRPGG